MPVMLVATLFITLIDFGFFAISSILSTLLGNPGITIITVQVWFPGWGRISACIGRDTTTPRNDQLS
jgi:hypothetical protein